VRKLLPDVHGEPDLERIYAFPDPGSGRYVRANFVESLDGAIEVGGRSGPLGGAGDKRIFHLLRALADVVLAGAGTVRAEKYGPAKLPADRRRSREQAGQLPVPPMAVVTARGLRSDSSLLAPVDGSPPPIVLTTCEAADRAPDEVRERAEIVACGAGRVDLREALDRLAERGLRRVLCEGGPSLLTGLELAGELDELCLTISPQLAGPERTGLTVGQAWPTPRGLELSTVLEEDGDLFLRYLRAAR
jgi:riboflavin biosynthesis pyrimidine reductase